MRDAQVGLMVVIAMVILVAGLMFFKRVSLDQDMLLYYVDFPAVEGLRKGDRVQARGIRVGQVEGFEIMPGKVRVAIEVEDWLQLTDTATAVLVMKGLVGEMLVEMEPGQGEAVQPGHVFTGRNAASMIELGDKVHRALDQMHEVGGELHALLVDLRENDRVHGPLQAAEQALNQTNEVLADNRDDLRRLTRNLAVLTEDLHGALGDGQLDSVLTATGAAAASLDSAMIELRTASVRANALLGMIEQGDGTIGRLMTDEALYDRADSTLESLDRFLDQLRRNPKAMVKMSLF
jgi:phospholipid/cholesterol/gamma-HCH transport system substrate-binding protein